MRIKSLTINAIGTKGLNTDLSPWELGPEFITYGVNFRIDNESITASSGYNEWYTPTSNFFPGNIIHVSVANGDYWVVSGRTAVKAFNGSVYTDISSTQGYSGLGVNDELKWTSCLLGNIPIINNPQSTIEYWSPATLGIKMKPLDFSPGTSWVTAGKSCSVIRSHNNFLFALNLVEGGVEQPNAYRWSHPADINGLPYTWDESDLSSIAGKAQIGGNAGAIVDGLSLRNDFIIYTEHSIHTLSPTGRSDFVWNRRELSSTVGLSSANTLVEVSGRHYFMGDGDIYVNDGNTVKSIVFGKIRKRLNSEANSDFYHRSFSIKNTFKKEIWFFVPEGDAEYPNIAYIYNWGLDSWSIRDIPYDINTKCLTSVYYGPKNSPSSTWATMNNNWSIIPSVWGSRQITPIDDTIVGVDNKQSSLLFLDPSSIDSNQKLNTVIERTGYPLDGDITFNTITRIYPHIKGTLPLTIEVGSQSTIDGPVKWSNPIQYTPGVTRKIDVRTTGSLLCWRLKSIDNQPFSVSGFTIEYSPTGYR